MARKLLDQVKTVEGKSLLLLAMFLAAVAAFQIVREREWLSGRAGVGLDVATGVVFALYAWAMHYGLRRLVLSPVQRARRHFERIADGDTLTPVRTRRTDEFGDMFRALERMRRSLAAATAARDVSERKHREILERSLYGFYQRTLDGRFIAANPALAAILGYESVDSLLGEPAGTMDGMYVDPTQRHEFESLIEAQGFASGFESALRRHDGRVIWVSEVSRKIVEDDGRTYLEGFIDDITSRKETEQIKADFVSFVTHQLRTPLAGIRWMLELAEQGALEEETATCVQDARLSAERLIQLVNDLLDVARLESGRLLTSAEPTALDQVTREVVADLGPHATAREQTLTVSGEGAPLVLIDPHLARQALANFLSNAIKYTPHGGSIHITAVQEGDAVRWSVRDTGIGVPSAAQARLFEKFFRADNAQVIDTEGTGLGLYLVRLIAMRTGGTVACESKEGVGSTFTLTLPVAQERQAVA